MIHSELLHYIKGTKRNIALNVLFRWFGLLVNIGISYSFVRLIYSFYEKENPPVFYFAGGLLGLWLLKFFLERKSEMIGFQLSQTVKNELRFRFLKKIIKIGPTYHQKMPTSKILQLGGDGVEQLQTYYAGFMPQLFFSILATLTMAGIVAFINVKTAAVLLLFSPLIPLVIYKGLSVAKKILGRYWKSYFDLGHVFADSIHGLSVAKIYGADGYKQEKMNLQAEDFRIKTMKLLRMQLNSINVMDIVAFGGLAAGIVTALLQLQKGNVHLFGMENAPGMMGVIFIILVCYDFFVPLRILGSLFHVAMNGIFASTFISSFLQLPDEDLGTKKISSENLDIELRNMSFSFTEKDFLKDLNMSFPQKKMTSIIGKSGCGKSTIVSLISGIVSGYKGSITIGNIENREIPAASRMQHIVTVTHNPYFFKGSVRENLHMAQSDASDQELLDVLKEVNLLDFILAQNGLDTLLTENAENFSGGQKQRLAIARALLTDAEVFIFDEATSNIEAESEAIILNLIQQMKQQKTIIMISHRLTNMVDSDQIYFMENGKVTEQGTHENLISAGGSYARLYRYQKELESYGNN